MPRMTITNDPLADFEAYDRQQEEWLESLPKCSHCKESIQGDYYFKIEGEAIHPDCLEEYCRKHYEVQNQFE